MSVVRKILGCTGDHRRNVGMMKELSLEKDIVEVVRTRRLSYFGHVARVDYRPYIRYSHILYISYHVGALKVTA